MNSWDHWNSVWQRHFEQFAIEATSGADSGHDINHIRRVVGNCRRLGEVESANAAVALPAAWLHDCVTVPKDSPRRSHASRLAADRAGEFLRAIVYPAQCHSDVCHAIAAHSFSARIPPETIEAQVVQDADRLEALGALGLARCLMTGGALGQRLYDPDEPFPIARSPDDSKQAIDHFFCKLLRLPKSMQTSSGRSLATDRAQILVRFLNDLSDELELPHECLASALSSMSIE